MIGLSLLSLAQSVQISKCSNIVSKKGIEVGHTFLLGDKYSKCFGAKFTSSQGTEVLQMGCFGLGVSRILAASLEALSDETHLKWPRKIVPFQIAILAPKENSKESSAMDLVYHLYDQLNHGQEFKNDVIIDDRGHCTVGKKLREAKQTGFTHVILFGKDCVDSQNPTVELYTVDQEMVKLPVNQIMYHFESLYQID